MRARMVWRRGRPSVPGEIVDLLASHPDTRGSLIRTVTPEHRVPFDRFRGEPRNADVVALADRPAGLIAISVEAKADEPFDRLVKDVLLELAKRIADDESTNGVARIQQLAWWLLPASVRRTSRLGDLRYQLLTGVAGAVAFAIAWKATGGIPRSRVCDRRHR